MPPALVECITNGPIIPNLTLSLPCVIASLPRHGETVARKYSLFSLHRFSQGLVSRSGIIVRTFAQSHGTVRPYSYTSRRPLLLLFPFPPFPLSAFLPLGSTPSLFQPTKLQENRYKLGVKGKDVLERSRELHASRSADNPVACLTPIQSRS